MTTRDQQVARDAVAAVLAAEAAGELTAQERPRPNRRRTEEQIAADAEAAAVMNRIRTS